MIRGAALLLLIAASAGCRPSPPPNPIPIISVDAREKNLGAHIADSPEIPSAVFTITNRGGAPLVVSKLALSCGCAEAQFPDGPMNPGESRKIVVKLKKAYKHGPLSTVLTVQSNDPIRPEFPLKVGWELLPSLIAEPEKLSWRGGPPSAPLRSTVRLAARAGEAPEIAAVEVHPSAIRATASRNGAFIDLKIAAERSQLPTSGDGYVRVRFKGDLDPAFVPLDWKFNDEFAFSPQSVSLSDLKAGAKSRFTISIRSASGAGFEVVGVRASNPAIRFVSSLPILAAGGADLKFEAEPRSAGPLLGEVSIEVRAKERFEKAVRIAGIVK